MASTSTSSTPLLWNYDVFISFRGEDTRDTFVDHLYTTLVKQGIHTYKDDETLRRGEAIAPSLLKAIQESRIAIIVFSQNYAESSWCLDELECIMKCRIERGQIVFPIFYGVNPSDVRNQRGVYGAAFEKHVKNANKVGTRRKKQRGKHGKAIVKYGSENNIKVKSWRDALCQAVNIAGWEVGIAKNRPESMVIQKIVEETSIRLFHRLSSDDTDLVGIETRKQDLKALLQVGSDDVHMVGIWGIGGGGKTTLGRCVFNEMSRGFDGCCFLRSIREKSNNYGLKKLQEEILSDILTMNVEVRQVEEGMRMIKSRLCHRKVFIVLDDVDDVHQLEALAGSHNWFGPGSRIIITSRDRHLLSSHRVDEIYNMPLLNDEEAIELFSRHAFRSSRPKEGFEEISRKVVSKVRGLSLALKVLGTSLYKRDMSEWISMFDRLDDDPHNLIIANLKSGYDGLQSSEKELFLDIACFYTLRPIDRAIVMLDACGYYPLIGVKVLIEKALITVSNGRFYVHDLLQDLARNIVRVNYSNSPEKQTRVWQKEDVLNICAVDVTKENDMNIEAIRLDPFIDDAPQCLPDVVAHMKKLRWLYWEGYPATSLPASFQPRNLCCLVLEDGLQKQLWRGSKLLPRLKVLDLRDSNNLIKTPDFSGLQFLERLILKDCCNLREIHPSIGKHKRIKFLDMKGCSMLKKFPCIVFMKALETLILSSCFRLSKFPEIRTSMPCLQELSLALSGIEVLPSSVGKYCTNLVSLDLSDCCRLESIEGDFYLLKELKILHLRGCIRLEKLPRYLFARSCQLEELSLCQSAYSEHTIINRFMNLMNDTRLQFYRQDLVSFRLPYFPRHLKRLSLRLCSLGDGDVPCDICELSNLEELDLSKNIFSRLHSTLTQLSRLKFLNLSDCQNLVELPDLPSSIAVLKAYRCDSLEIVDLPTHYKWLWKVSLWRKSKLIGGEKVLQTMIQGNATEDHFLSVRIGYCYIQSSFDWINIDKSLVFKDMTFTLQLPQNWYNDFSGFLICVANLRCVKHTITIKQETSMDCQSDPWVEFDKTPEFDTNMEVGYISFGSLRRTSWWNSEYNKISFFMEDLADPGFKVGLVPRKSKCNPEEGAQSEKNCSEYWDEGVEDRNTFVVQHDSKTCIKIFWSHRCGDWA